MHNAHMAAEHAPTPETRETQVSEERHIARIRKWIELLSAILLAAATMATAWSAYQAARWGGDSNSHNLRSIEAMVQTSKFRNLAEQKRSLHVSLFGQWAVAVAANNTALADFIFNRFPEPLKTATIAWRATQPLTNPDAPRSPFEMAEYALAEMAEAQKWEEFATTQSQASDRASTISNRYLLFTVIFAAVLFFAGISGKFTWIVIDEVVLALGALVMLIGLGIMFTLPIA